MPVTAQSVGEGILTIGWHLAMLDAEVEWDRFSGHAVYKTEYNEQVVTKHNTQI